VALTILVRQEQHQQVQVAQDTQTLALLLQPRLVVMVAAAVQERSVVLVELAEMEKIPGLPGQVQLQLVWVDIMLAVAVVLPMLSVREMLEVLEVEAHQVIGHQQMQRRELREQSILVQAVAVAVQAISQMVLALQAGQVL
jgi:hypothetical protein